MGVTQTANQDQSLEAWVSECRGS